MADTPVPFFKLSFEFVAGSGLYGWSEIYYVSAADDSAARAAANILVPLRVAILGDNYFLDDLRISQEGVRGDATATTGLPTPGLLDATMFATVDPASCLLIRTGVADHKSRGHKFLHGVLERMFRANQRYDPANADDMAVQAYCSALGAAPFCLKSKRLEVAGAPYLTLTGASPIRKVTHRIGRPFGAYRGRRLAV
jgi:hypothetical protein